MANCKKFMELSDRDQVIYIAEVLHAIRSNDLCFEEGKKIIRAGYKRGAFNGVKILPSPEELAQGEPKGEDLRQNDNLTEIIN